MKVTIPALLDSGSVVVWSLGSSCWGLISLARYGVRRGGYDGIGWS